MLQIKLSKFMIRTAQFDIKFHGKIYLMSKRECSVVDFLTGRVLHDQYFNLVWIMTDDSKK